MERSCKSIALSLAGETGGERKAMETIYKGTLYEWDVDSDTAIDTATACLFNPAMREKVRFSVKDRGTTDGIISYLFTLSTTTTAAASAGVYHLEIYDTNGAMVKHFNNFARIVTTSKSTN